MAFSIYYSLKPEALPLSKAAFPVIGFFFEDDWRLPKPGDSDAFGWIKLRGDSEDAARQQQLFNELLYLNQHDLVLSVSQDDDWEGQEKLELRLELYGAEDLTPLIDRN